MVNPLVPDYEPVTHPDDPVGERADLGVVGHEDDGLATLTVEPSQEAEDLRRVGGVEVARRLVGQDQRRLVDQAADGPRAASGYPSQAYRTVPMPTML